MEHLQTGPAGKRILAASLFGVSVCLTACVSPCSTCPMSGTAPRGGGGGGVVSSGTAPVGYKHFVASALKRACRRQDLVSREHLVPYKRQVSGTGTFIARETVEGL